MRYSSIIGIETHIELSTNTKIFCSCPTRFGGEPNTQCCPVCIGLPGALPVLNKSVVDFAIMAGLAFNCEISLNTRMSRKNYFYPDLPKAYQITQFDTPLCTNGYIELSSGKKIRIQRVHIEEDAGKLIHKNSKTLIDYNRAGVPLLEIVTHPDIESAEEACEYITSLRDIIRTLGISDCKMEEGSMRCDVNISIKKDNSLELGTKTEIKNVNSIKYISKAIDFEIKRQADLIETGTQIKQETRRFDEKTGATVSMRSKEKNADYRYFPEPDIPIISVSQNKIDIIKQSLPEMPWSKQKRYVKDLGIPQNDAIQLSRYPKVSEFFEEAVIGIKKPVLVSNFILGQIFSSLKSEHEKSNFCVNITAKQLNELVKLVDSGEISHNIAKGTLSQMLETGKSACEILPKDKALIDNDALKKLCDRSIKCNPSAVNDYKNGKTNALKFLVGCVMRESKGMADAKTAEKIIHSLII